MGPSQEIQWDLETAPPGGTFLVLNLGTNTVGLGSSCFFQTFPPIAIRGLPPLKARPRAAPHAVAGSSNQKAVEETATVAGDGGDSSEEGPTHEKSGRRIKDDDDPEWVMNGYVKWRSDPSVGGRAVTMSTRRQRGVKPSAKAPTVGDNAKASPSSKAFPPEPTQLPQEGLPQSSDGGDNEMGSSMEPPPTYLVNLLQFFGWSVTFHDSLGALYTSPDGLMYRSLPKAFENFLRDHSSKCEEREGSPSQTSDGGGIGEPGLSLQTGLGAQDVVGTSLKGRRGRKRKNDATSATQDVVKESLKKKRGRKRRNDATTTIAEPVIPQGSGEEQLASGIQETGEKDGKKSSLLPEEIVSPSKEVSQMAATPRVTRGGSNNNKNLYVQLPGPRRSARLSGKHTFYGSDSDSEDDADDYSLYSPEADEEMPASLASDDTSKMCDEKSEDCMEHEILKPEKLDCSSEILTEKNQSCTNTMNQDNILPEVRRSSRGSKEHVSANMEVNLDREYECNFLDSSEILDSNSVKRNEGNLIRLAPQMLNVAHEKAKSCKEVDHLMRDAEQFDKSNMVLGVNAQNGSNEVRRYMDLNRNDVSMDDGTGIEMGIGVCLSNLSVPAVNALASDNNEKPIASTVEVENMEGATYAQDNVFAEVTVAEDVVCDILGTQIEPKSNILKKTLTGRTRKKDSDKCLRQEDNLQVPVPLKSTSLSASQRNSAYGGCVNGKRKKRRPKCGLIVRKNVNDDHQKEVFAQKKVTALSWMIDAGILAENEMLVHKLKNDRTVHLMRGLATRDGICCLCCQKIMSLLEFESHAGSDLCQPWYNICLESGKSLMQCQIDVWEKEKKLRRVGFQMVGADGLDPSDDTCGICADGGNLICCDSCPSTFHQDCVMLKDFPEGRWHCPFCLCTFCFAAENGSDRVNQALSLFTCQQCYRKYHWECTRESGQHENLAESLLFCGKDCKEVDTGLFGLLGVVNKIGENFSWTLLKRLDEHEELNSDQNLLFMMECNRKMSMALSVLDECFMPVVDLTTGVDLISHTVYNCGSNFKRLNCAGFYVAVLEKNEEVISVASLRFHGRHLAEMPFIGTRPMYQGQGMCHRLLRAIEDLLSSLHVMKLIIPATEALLETWVTSFSFKPLEQSDKDEVRKFGLVVLPQTILLQKSIPPKREDCREDDPVGAVGDPGKAAPGVHDLQSDVGKQTKFGSCVVGGPILSLTWNSEGSRLGEKHAPVQSQTEAKTFSSAAHADACGGDLRLGISCGQLVSETSPAAQHRPTNCTGGAPARAGETCTRFASFDGVLDGSLGCKVATGPGDASAAASSRSTDMAEDAGGDGVRPPVIASTFQWTSS